MSRWRGLASLVKDAVEHGSIAIEKLQKQTADRPFSLLEQLPAIAGPAKVIHALHDGSVTVTHTAIRLANRVVANALEGLLPPGANSAGEAGGVVGGGGGGGPPEEDALGHATG